MKKKNGFISMTVIFSLFVLFLMVLLSIVVYYSSNRILLRKSRNAIKSSLVEQLRNNCKSPIGYVVNDNQIIVYNDI